MVIDGNTIDSATKVKALVPCEGSNNDRQLQAVLGLAFAVNKCFRTNRPTSRSEDGEDDGCLFVEGRSFHS